MGFKEDEGAIFLAAGVLHYLTHEAVTDLVSDMARRFPGGLFVFDYVSAKGKAAGTAQVRMSGNATDMPFALSDAQTQIAAMSDKVSKVVVRSYLEGYPIEDVSYGWLTRLYIRAKRDQYFVAHVEFAR